MPDISAPARGLQGVPLRKLPARARW